MQNLENDEHTIEIQYMLNSQKCVFNSQQNTCSLGNFVTSMQKTSIFRHSDYCKGSMLKTAYKMMFTMKQFVYFNAETWIFQYFDYKNLYIVKTAYIHVCMCVGIFSAKRFLY